MRRRTSPWRQEDGNGAPDRGHLHRQRPRRGHSRSSGSPSFPGRRIVTREGEIISRDGTIIFVGRGGEILKRKREIRELQESHRRPGEGG
ncbi:MAG: hypothetical protein MZU91_00380 [Desulfosudis oleivorans]|nr:hypothetical protein [Desulfosudis oleivorans]